MRFHAFFQVGRHRRVPSRKKSGEANREMKLDYLLLVVMLSEARKILIAGKAMEHFPTNPS